jgi:hypothetical protein
MAELVTNQNAKPVGGSMAYGVLKQTHGEYDGGLLAEIEDLYVGGFRIIKKAKKYLVKLVNEHARRYDERCGTASYQPYFGQIVDQFTSDVFGQPLSIKPAADADNPNTPGEMPDKDYYSSLEKDVDGQGTLFVDLMLESLRCALKTRCAIVAYDAPRDDASTAVKSKADEEALGLNRLYAYHVPVEQLIDWKCKKGSKKGVREFEWAILNTVEQERETPADKRDVIVETFMVWTVGESGKAHWQKYVIRYKPDNKPQAETPVPLEDEGDSGFTQIPLLRLELSEGLWVGNKIGPQAKEHWQRRSALVGAQARSMVAIPFIKKGPEAPAVGGAIPAEITQNPHRGDRPVDKFNNEGWLELGSEDEAGFAEPKGSCYELVAKQLDELRDAMFSVNHQMAASIRPTHAGSLGRSGLSKQKDEDATARVLRALGHEIRQFAVRVYDAISRARGEDVHWTPHGLDGYDSEDPTVVLESAIALPQIPIKSPTFRKVYKRVYAGKLLRGAVDPETMTTINGEIDDEVDDEVDQEKLVTEAAIDRIKNPPPPIVAPPGAQIPMPQVPQAKVPAAKAPPVPKPGKAA